MMLRNAKQNKNGAFFTGNNTCFYGVCTYCRPDDAVCGNKSVLEGAVVLWLPNRFRLVKQRHPWQRSYSSSLAKYVHKYITVSIFIVAVSIFFVAVDFKLQIRWTGGRFTGITAVLSGSRNYSKGNPSCWTWSRRRCLTS